MQDVSLVLDDHPLLLGRGRVAGKPSYRLLIVLTMQWLTAVQVQSFCGGCDGVS